MGLDISFDLQPALRAGLQTRIFVENGIEFIEEDGSLEPENILNMIALPGEDEYWRASDMYIGARSKKARCMVRANHWGSLYTPLTEFLTKHSIEWIET